MATYWKQLFRKKPDSGPETSASAGPSSPPPEATADVDSGQDNAEVAAPRTELLLDQDQPDYLQYLNWPVYNVPDRCGLCSFLFDTDSSISIYIDNKTRHDIGRYAVGRLLAYDAPKKFCVRCVDERERGWSISTVLKGTHSDCLLALPKLYPYSLPGNLLGSAEYQYRPLMREEVKRWSRVQYRTRVALQENFPEARLPAEIWDMVAGYLVPLYAASGRLQLWGSRERSEVQLAFGQGIRAHYVNIEGVRYIKRLSRTDDPETLLLQSQDGNDLLASRVLFDGKATTKTHMYVLQDHVGVRQIVFADPNRHPATFPTYAALDGADDSILDSPAMWWMTHVFAYNESRIRLVHDGVKARSLYTLKTLESTLVYPVPTPMAKINMNEHYRLKRYPEAAPISYMHSIVCNEPDTTGYSVLCWDQVVTFHAHKPGESLAFYRHFDAFCAQSMPTFRGQPAWLYFPVGADERIEYICQRRQDDQNDRRILFLTNKNRPMNLGPACMSTREQQFWTVLERLHIEHGPSRIYYHVGSRVVEEIGMDNTFTGAFTPPSVRWLYVEEQFRPKTAVFSHRASLRNVARITLCRETGFPAEIGFDQTCTFVTGMLFEYSDDQPPACVGEYRLDRAGTPVDVANTPQLCFGYAEPSKHVLLRVEAEKIVDEATPLQWLTIPWSGQLEAWCRRPRCEVFHVPDEE